MLAVLPFENLTGDPNKEYVADGLTEETISHLGRLNPEQLGVIARTVRHGIQAQGRTPGPDWTRSFLCSMCWKTVSAKAELTYD